MAGHRARKRFGQNFLHDDGVIRDIVNAIRPGPDDHLVEIGPGKGALTRPLLEACGRIDVIELDRDLPPLLKKYCHGAGELIIHSADALKFDFAQLASDGRRLRIVGNLPYNISTPLIFHLLDFSPVIEDMHFMLQEEVVSRLTATPGGKDYGRLSIMVQLHCKAEKLFTVSPASFTPAPKVYSAIVRLTPWQKAPVTVDDYQVFAQIVKQAFAMRRKTLANNLKDWLDSSLIESLDINPQRRAETLTLEEFARLADCYSRQANR